MVTIERSDATRPPVRQAMRRAALYGAALGALCVPAFAVAQTAVAGQATDTGQPTDTGQTTDAPAQDIVVTAQFRSQRLQDTPLAISAVTGDQLDARGQTNVAQLGAQTPNLTVKQTGDAFGPAAAIFIRGIGQYDSSFALEPGVGVYVDDVYYSTVFGTTFDLVDLDRVEVLRGPQGTLAGKNAIGGALKLYSRLPGNEWGGFGEATVGRFDRIDLRGSVNVPLVADRLALRLSGVRNESDGYVTRYDYGCLYPDSGVPSVGGSGTCKLGTSGGRKSWGLRGLLNWTPADTVRVVVAADYSEDHSGPPASVSTYVDGQGRSFLNGTPFDNRFVTAGTYRSYATYSDPGGVYIGLNPATGQPAVTVQPSSGFAVNPDTDLADWGVSARGEIDLSPDLKLLSITAYRGYHGLFATDVDGTPFNYQLTRQDLRHRQFSQELRLTGRLADALDWTVGGLFFDERNRQGGRVQIPATVDTVQDDRIATRSYSAFAHATWHVTSAFDLTGGLRYSHDRKQNSFNRSAPQQAAIDGQTARYQGGRVDYKLNAAYKLTPDVLAYAQFSTGYRAGGANPRPFFTNQVVSFDPERLDAYELGLKTSAFDRRLTLNLAAFRNDYRDILVSSLAPYTNPDRPIDENPASPGYNPAAGTFPAFVVLNGGAARLTGLELELFARPTAALRIDGSVSYLDFHYTSLSAIARASGLDRDSALPFAPKWKWNVGVQNGFDLGRAGTLTPRLDVTYQSAINTQSAPSAYSRIGGYALANARLTYALPDKAWQVSVAVLNLFDRYYYLTAFDTATQSGTATAQPGRPREWTLGLRRSF